MKICIYIRKSTNHQSFQRQIQLFKEYRYLLDDGTLNKDIGVVGLYTESISGRKDVDDRKELSKLIKYIDETKQINPNEQITVICESLSRLSRTLIGVLDVIGMINNAGAVLKTLKEGFDFRSDSATSRLLISLIAAVNQFEVEVLRERVSEGMRATKKKIGRPRVPSKKVKAALEVMDNNVNNLSVEQIASAFGVSKRTLYYAKKTQNL